MATDEQLARVGFQIMNFARFDALKNVALGRLQKRGDFARREHLGICRALRAADGFQFPPQAHRRALNCFERADNFFFSTHLFFEIRPAHAAFDI